MPEDPFKAIQEKYGSPQVREWARAVLIREAIKVGLIDRPTGRALIRLGMTEIIPADPVESMGSPDEVA
ncbi:hypothetical protein [Nodosilinea nodulosa]|uniref:hypothetical protein n=1 Tax=Nodosilinea nodulosa TaxID=416001 RepID=UPI000367A5F6|nr:hypothetical protein [Nodosilinea nodulosa]